MDFSIIVPVYNIEKYIHECVLSILHQKNVEYEIILVDDGSKDQSGVLCDEIAKNNKNVRVIHKTNGGLSDARNTGISAAVGEYLIFVDGDDFIAENSLEKILKVAQKNSMPDVICLEMAKFFDRDIENVIPMKDGIDERINSLNGEELYKYIRSLPKLPASACSKAIKRELFLQNDLFFIKGLLSEDLEWCVRLFSVAQSYAYCQHTHYFYRQERVGSISNSISQKHLMDILSTVKKWNAYATKVANKEKKFMILSCCEYMLRLLILHYHCVEKDNRKAFKNEVKQESTVLGYRTDTTSIIIRLSYRLCGIDLANWMLNIYMKCKRK